MIKKSQPIYEQTSQSVTQKLEYNREQRDKLRENFDANVIYKVRDATPENVEYLIADDFAQEKVISRYTSAEERAYQVLTHNIKTYWPGYEFGNFSPQFFLKHSIHSSIGHHLIFGLKYRGYEIDEHSFVVHANNENHIVMISSTYLPDLPKLLTTPWDKVDREKIRNEITKISNEQERVEAEEMWLTIWDGGKYIIAPGEQIKVIPKKQIPSQVIRVTEKFQQAYQRSLGLGATRFGLGTIVRALAEATNRDDFLRSLRIENLEKSSALLRDLEAGSELSGPYAVITAQIDNLYKFGDVTNFIDLPLDDSKFDRITAYYHLDRVQRYFREKLGLHVLDEYSHLNPLHLTLLNQADLKAAEYNVDAEEIRFYRLWGKYYTVARDPRYIYHEYVHAVTDAIARLQRGDRDTDTPRKKDALQAAAMDEGLADYFACSLVEKEQQTYSVGPLFFYGQTNRDLDPDNDDNEGRSISDLLNAGECDKYILCVFWGRYLWKLRRKINDADIADTLIAHSIYFLTRWSTFQQGMRALQLVDRLLFSKKYEKDILKTYMDFGFPLKEHEDYMIELP